MQKNSRGNSKANDDTNGLGLYGTPLLGKLISPLSSEGKVVQSDSWGNVKRSLGHWTVETYGIWMLLDSEEKHSGGTQLCHQSPFLPSPSMLSLNCSLLGVGFLPPIYYKWMFQKVYAIVFFFFMNVCSFNSSTCNVNAVFGLHDPLSEKCHSCHLGRFQSLVVNMLKCHSWRSCSVPYVTANRKMLLCRKWKCSLASQYVPWIEIVYTPLFKCRLLVMWRRNYFYINFHHH